MDLPGGAHADGDQAGQQVGGDGETRALGDVVDLAGNFQTTAGPAGQGGEQFSQGLTGAFHAGRHDSGGDDGGFQETEIVAPEVEDFGER